MSNRSDRPENSSPDAVDRRAAPRLQLLSPVSGKDDTGGDVTLVNISDGGVLVHTTEAVSLGQIRRYDFPTPGSAESLRFSARVVHVMRVSAAARATYVVGLEFDPPLDAAAKRALRTLTAG